MNRFIAVLLAVFIGGPTCLCHAGSEVAPPKAPHRTCCEALQHADGQDAPVKPAPSEPCDCNQCLAKRMIASDAPQIPSITWTAATPQVLAHAHDLPACSWTPSISFLMDTGPPHERQAIFVRHCALLL